MATAKAAFEEYLIAEGEIGDRFRSLWLDQMHKLEEAGYNGESWSRAAHIVWCAQPKKLRVPSSEAALAGVLGKAEKTLRNWRHADERDSTKLYATGAESVKQLFNEWLPNVALAAYEMAVTGGKDGASDRRLLFAAAGITTNNTDLTSGGAPMMAYTVLANPDMWDDPTDEPKPAANPASVGASAVADRPLEG
jgi:hypothetical protein